MFFHIVPIEIMRTNSNLHVIFVLLSCYFRVIPLLFSCYFQSQMYEWWSCVPVIKGVFTAPGVLEVFWELPPQASIHLLHGYQVRGCAQIT